MRPFGIIRPRGRDADLDRAIVGAPVIEVMGCGAIRAATGRACPTDSHSGLFEHGFGTLEACQKARLKLARLAMSHSPVSPRDGVGDQASLRQAWNLTDPPTHTFEPGTRSSMSVPGTSRGRGPSSEMSTGQPESLVRESLWGPKSPHQDILIRTWARAALTNLPKFRRSGGLRLQDSIRLSSGWGSGILQIDRGEEEGTRHLALGTGVKGKLVSEMERRGVGRGFRQYLAAKSNVLVCCSKLSLGAGCSFWYCAKQGRANGLSAARTAILLHFTFA